MMYSVWVLSMLLLSIIAAFFCIAIVTTVEESEQKSRIDALEKEIMKKDEDKTGDETEVTR